MLEIQLIRDQKERAVTGLKKRGFGPDRLQELDQVIALDDQRKEIQTKLDYLLSQRNTLSDEIGNLFKQGKAAEANALKTKVQEIKDQAESLNPTLKRSGLLFPILQIQWFRTEEHLKTIRYTRNGRQTFQNFRKARYLTGTWRRDTT